MIPDFEIKVTPGSYEEVSERFKTYLRFRFGTDPASVFITGATGCPVGLPLPVVKQTIWLPHPIMPVVTSPSTLS